MTACKGTCLPALSAAQLFALVSRVVSVNTTAVTAPVFDDKATIDPRPATGKEGTVTLAATPPALAPSVDVTPASIVARKRYATAAETVTASELTQRQIRAVAIMLAESGGIPNAWNTNGATTAAPGTHDRGLPQWNDSAFAWISDRDALDPAVSVSLFYEVSKHFSSWGPWTGSKGLDNASAPYQLAAKTEQDMTGIVTPADDPITGIAVDAGSAVAGGLAAVLPALSKLLGVLTSAAFWQRFGIGIAGGLLLLLGLVVLARPSIRKALG